MEKGDKIHETFDTLYGDILDTIGDIKLVDNNLFINWLFNFKRGAESPPASDSRADLPELVVRFFYSD